MLRSILIHDGVADSGHYYSYICDHDGTWQKYNDIQVSEEKEEHVFKEAIGGLNHISAYCLVYVSQKSIDEETGHINKYLQNNMNLARELEVPKQHYTIFLSEEIKNEVDQENRRFYEEVQEYRFQTLIKNIAENYQTRLDILTSVFNSLGSSQAFPFYINSFGLFLKHEIKSEELLKWYVLDTSLQDTNPNAKFKLRDVKSQPRLLRILQNCLASIGRQYWINSLVLPKEDEHKLDAKLAEYMDQIPGAIISLFILEKSLQEQWLDVLYGVKTLVYRVKTTSFGFLIETFLIELSIDIILQQNTKEHFVCALSLFSLES